MSDDLLTRATELRNLAESQRRNPATDGGVAAYEQAIALLRQTHDYLKLAHAIRHLGDVHMEQGRPGLAAPCYDEAVALYRAHPAPPPLDLANALRGQAILKQEQAANLWEEAGKLYEQTGVEAGAAEARRRLALLVRQ